MNSQRLWQHIQIQSQARQITSMEKENWAQSPTHNQEAICTDDFWERKTNFLQWYEPWHINHSLGQASCSGVVWPTQSGLHVFSLFVFVIFFERTISQVGREGKLSWRELNIIKIYGVKKLKIKTKGLGKVMEEVNKASTMVNRRP